MSVDITVIPREILSEMDRMYSLVDRKQKELALTLEKDRYRCKLAWYNNEYNYAYDGEGEAVILHPIPVISIDGVCQIQILFDKINVAALIRPKNALSCDYGVLQRYSFRVRDESMDYRSEYYNSGNCQDITELMEKIVGCGKRCLAFVFTLPLETNGESMSELVSLLRRERFFYY